MEKKLYEKLQIAFKYGIKVTIKHSENNDCDDVYFDRAVAVIERLYLSDSKESKNEILLKYVDYLHKIIDAQDKAEKMELNLK